MRKTLDVFVALMCIAGAIASYSVYGGDQRSRVGPAEFATTFTMPLRRPDIVKSLEYAPSGDFAADLVADATLRDVVVPVNLGGLEPNVRAAWIDAVPSYDQQMERAADLMLDAVAERPGWPYHQSLLGQLVYTRGRQSLSPDLVSHHARWSRPLYLAATDAGSDETLWQSLALGYLQTWPALADAHRQTAAPAFRRAFAEPEFVRAAFTPALEILGKEQAIAFLPDLPRGLAEGARQLAAAGDVDAAWRLHRRWEAAEWRLRSADLDNIVRRSRRGDVDDARHLCSSWTEHHSIWDFDSPEARVQAATLLEQWPEGVAGHWPEDPRAQILRFVMARPATEVDSASVLRALRSLSGVPLPLQASIRVLAGDIAGAEAVARGSEMSLEWKPYALELARYWLQLRDRQKAQAAVSMIPAAAQEECEVRALRAELAPATMAPGDAIDFTRVWEERAEVPICVEPRSTATLKLALASGARALVDYGWDGARAGSVLLGGPEPVVVSLPASQGLRTLSMTVRYRSEGVAVSSNIIVSHRS